MEFVAKNSIDKVDFKKDNFYEVYFIFIGKFELLHFSWVVLQYVNLYSLFVVHLWVFIKIEGSSTNLY